MRVVLVDQARARRVPQRDAEPRRGPALFAAAGQEVRRGGAGVGGARGAEVRVIGEVEAPVKVRREKGES